LLAMKSLENASVYYNKSVKLVKLLLT